MRIAVVSDIHGNMTAFDAVLADLAQVAPDLVVHGGDLCNGSRTATVIDRIRDLNWPGVYGNADEMMWDPQKADAYLASVGLDTMRPILAKQIAFMLDEIGPERLAWLRALTLRYSAHNLTVVHATPTDAWGIVPHDAPDEQLERVFAPLGTPRVVYGHIHRSFVRPLPTFVLANSGCVSLSYDGDPRAAYAVLDNHQVTIRRVEYDIGRETAALKQVRFPYASWMAEMLRNGYVPPPAVEDVE